MMVYIDDILVSGKSVEEHLQNLHAVLTKLEEAGLRLKREKCSILMPSVEYLGYKITEKGLQPTAEKVEAVQSAPAPQDISQLKSFIGLVNYYGKFLPDLSTVLSPLYRLLQKEDKWYWGKEQQSAFEKVKNLLASDGLLVHYDPDQELICLTLWGWGCAFTSRRGWTRETDRICFKDFGSGRKLFAVRERRPSKSFRCKEVSSICVQMPNCYPVRP